jgi:hypothetical protein
MLLLLWSIIGSIELFSFINVYNKTLEYVDMVALSRSPCCPRRRGSL